MKKQIALLTIAAALMAVPAAIQAQDAAAHTPAAASVQKHHAGRFHGKVTAVDATGMTLTVKDRSGKDLTVNVTSKTKITKKRQPATLSDITADDAVTGGYKTDDAGKMNATFIHILEKKKKAE